MRAEVYLAGGATAGHSFPSGEPEGMALSHSVTPQAGHSMI